MTSHNPLKEEHLKTLERMAKLQNRPSSSSTAAATSSRKRSRPSSSMTTSTTTPIATQTPLPPQMADPTSIGLSISRSSSSSSLLSSTEDSLPIGVSVKTVIEHLKANRRPWTRDELLSTLERLDARALDELKQNPKVEFDAENETYAYRANFVGINNVDDLLHLLKRPEHENGIPFEQLKDSYKTVDSDLRQLHAQRRVLLVTAASNVGTKSSSTATAATARALADAYPNTPKETAERIYTPQISLGSSGTIPNSNVVVFYNDAPEHAIQLDDEIKVMWHQLTSEIPNDPVDLSGALRRAGLKETELLDLRSQHLLDTQQRQLELLQQQKRAKSRKIRKLTNKHLQGVYDFSNPDG